ncbi:MAG: response regulator transcription factor [Anaerolineae bacterium]|nr:response regulator transcription factor [Anaerolineae bacterium]
MSLMLIVDDDHEFRETLVKTLRSQGYRAVGISDPDGLASAVALYQPQIILLDMMFGPDISGLKVCQRLRTWCSIPVIILSVIDDEVTKVQVLDSGADDYLTKPFGVSELLARVRAVQRRLDQSGGSANPVLVIGDLSIDLDARLVKLCNQPIHLTRKEFMLLKCLAEAKGRLVTYEKVAEAIWETPGSGDRGKVRGLVMQLRNKLGEDLSNPRYILTDAGVGYRLNLEA